TLEAVGRAPARFDLKKLENLNGYYMRAADDGRLADLVSPLIATAISRELSPSERSVLLGSMAELKPRAKNINDLSEASLFLFRERPLDLDAGAARLLEGEAVPLLAAARDALASTDSWSTD